MSGLSHLVSVGRRQGSAISMEGTHTRYSRSQPLGLGTQMWRPKIVYLLPVILKSWERAELFLAAVAPSSFEELQGRRASMVSDVQCPVSRPRASSGSRASTALIQPQCNGRGVLAALDLCHGLNWVSGCTAFLCFCPFSKREALALLTNLWAAQHAVVNSWNVFFCLTDTVICKESSPT